jgi:hypothetical protein
MYQRDWIDNVRWGAIGSGMILGLALQVLLTVAVLRPLHLMAGWGGVIVVELCVAAGAFLAAWLARRSPLTNGLAAALGGAAISLVATAVRAPQSLNVLSVLFLFGTFAVMGLLGGGAALLAHARAGTR